jgi:glycosyltransferase involved in cell wall biosynthesis
MYPSKRRYKVLITDDGLDIGGKEHQLSLLAKYLPNEWERKVWAMNGGPNHENLLAHNISSSVRSRKWRFDISPAFDLWKLILDWRPEIIHAWGWMGCIAAAPLCRILGIPIINGVIRGSNRPLRWTQSLGQWLSLKMADGIIANSRAGLEVWGITNKNGIVVYNGFDPERLKLLKQSNKNGKFTVVMVGRMFEEKDFSRYIDAARLVSKEGGSWRFLAIGFGPERSKLVASAKDLIEMKILEFPEAGMEVIPLIDSADVGVLMTTPLIYEGCSNAIMEYMGLRLPVICTLGGGNQEIVIDGQTGFLIPPGKSEALADRLRFLYENRDLARKMGDAGHKRFLQLFSAERMVEETVEYYNQYK